MWFKNEYLKSLYSLTREVSVDLLNRLLLVGLSKIVMWFLFFIIFIGSTLSIFQGLNLFWQI